MENTFIYDIVVLKRVLNFTIKNLKKDHHLSVDSRYGRSQRKKIRYVKWILNLIRNPSDLTYHELLDMIDLKIEARKKDLANTLAKNQKETIEDSIKSLGWLRNIIETTSKLGFNDIIFS
jgi:hypothetical protein